jgi:hypothetical protein
MEQPVFKIVFKIESCILPADSRVRSSELLARNIIILWSCENALHLVGVSSACFGLEIMRGTFRKLSGWVAIAVGILSFLGQIPSSGMLFLLACLADLLWYTGIDLPFRGLASEGQMNMTVKGSAMILIDAPFLSLVN